MRTNFFLSACAVLLLFSSCTKQTQAPFLQTHNDNAVMMSLHEMITNTDNISFSKGLEGDFIDVMQTLHHGGLEMANGIFHENKNDSLMQIAEGVSQDLHVLLYDLKKVDSGSLHNEDSLFRTEFVINLAEMSEVSDVQLITGDVDNDYATLMIPHHELVIATCNSYLKYGSDSSFRSKVQEIIDLENAEILELTSWLIENKR